jgi:hypothetical protein
MTEVKTIATHELVRHLFPRPPPTERDELGMAVGKAIDGALSQWSHQFGRVQGVTAASVKRYAHQLLEQELKDVDLTPDAATLASAQAEVERVVQAFRKSEVFGMPRPRSRLVVINQVAGVYAQPDYWDGATRFFEMKSFRAVPPPPDVECQVRVFQLAFPGLRSFLACFNRHADPVETLVAEVPPPEAQVRDALLREMLALALAEGKLKVLEYVENPIVRYEVPPAP